jgi:hypothetical protein
LACLIIKGEIVFYFHQVPSDKKVFVRGRHFGFNAGHLAWKNKNVFFEIALPLFSE